MKKLVLILALILCVSVLASCNADEPADTTAAETTGNVEDTELVTKDEVTSDTELVTKDEVSSDTVEDTDIAIDPSVQNLLDDDRYFIRLDWYLNILSSYIHEPHENGDELDNEYLPYMVIQCCALNRNICDAEFDEEIGAITISKSELLRVGNMLFGKDIPADDIDEYFSAPYATDFFTVTEDIIVIIPL